MSIKYYYTVFKLLNIPFITYMVNSYIPYFLEIGTSGSNVLNRFFYTSIKGTKRCTLKDRYIKNVQINPYT